VASERLFTVYVCVCKISQGRKLKSKSEVHSECQFQHSQKENCFKELNHLNNNFTTQ